MKFPNLKRVICVAMAAITLFSVVPAIPSKAAAPIPGSIAVGIDVSKHNGPINWQAVAGSGVNFAFIRIGTTLKGIDPMFYQNMKGAAAAGIRTGVYIYSYATTPAEAAAEANLVLSNLGDCTVSFPIVIDMESNPQKTKSREELTNVANTFCSIIENAGYYPMVYASKNWFAGRMNPIGYDKWVAQYGDVCEDPSRSVWQASCTGSIPGVGGNVDINYLYKDYASIIISDGFSVRKGNTYLYKNYKMQTGWQEFAGNRYYLDATGKLQTGWIQVDDTGRHYMQPGGELTRGLAQVEGATYFFNNEGVIQTGFVDTGAGNYFFNPEGKMQTGFISDGTYQYYFNPTKAVGHVEIEGSRYYFNEKGQMQTGFVDADGTKYFFGADGKMQTGFINDGTNTYYFNPGMTIGVATMKDGVYYFNEKGQMQTGIVTINGAQFMFGADGKMLKGWFDNGTNKYYLQPDTGSMVVNNWAAIDGKMYYFNAEGKMQTGIIQVGPNSYCTDATGVMITNQLLPLGDTTYYFGADGLMAKNTKVELAGITYEFNGNGQMISAVPVAAPVAPVAPAPAN